MEARRRCWSTSRASELSFNRFYIRYICIYIYIYDHIRDYVYLNHLRCFTCYLTPADACGLCFPDFGYCTDCTVPVSYGRGSHRPCHNHPHARRHRAHRKVPKSDMELYNTRPCDAQDNISDIANRYVCSVCPTYRQWQKLLRSFNLVTCCEWHRKTWKNRFVICEFGLQLQAWACRMASPWTLLQNRCIGQIKRLDASNASHCVVLAAFWRCQAGWIPPWCRLALTKFVATSSFDSHVL